MKQTRTQKALTLYEWFGVSVIVGSVVWAVVSTYRDNVNTINELKEQVEEIQIEQRALK